MAMFNSYVCLPEGRYHKQIPYIPYVSTPFKYHIYIYIYIPSINTIQRPYQQHHTSHGMNFPISQDTVQAKNDGENLAYQAQRHSTGDVGKPMGKWGNSQETTLSLDIQTHMYLQKCTLSKKRSQVLSKYKATTFCLVLSDLKSSNCQPMSRICTALGSQASQWSMI